MKLADFILFLANYLQGIFYFFKLFDILGGMLMKESLWTKDYISAIMILMLCHVGPYLLLSVITVIGKQLTGSDTYAGMLASVFSLFSMPASFIGVWLLDRIGYKKSMLLSILILVIVSAGFIVSNSYWILFFLRGFQGFGYGMATTIINTYIVSLVHKEKLVEGVGYASLTNSLGGIIGPSLAYTILGNQYNSFYELFIVLLLIELVTFLMVLFTKNIDNMNMRKREISLKSHVDFSMLPIIIPVIVAFLNSMASSSLSSFLTLYVVEMGIGEIGLYFTINAIGLFVSRFTMKALNDKLGPDNIIKICCIILFVCIYVISIVDTLWQILAVAFPIGFATGTIAPIINVDIINQMPDSKSGLANALFSSFVGLGFVFGATFWGMISNILSYSYMFKLSSFIYLIVLVLIGTQKKLFKS